MTDDMADHMKNTIAFLVARHNEDDDAMAFLAHDCESTLELLMGMTDFALSQIELLAECLGLPVQKMIDALGINMARMTGRA